jgi:hypothetical protein
VQEDAGSGQDVAEAAAIPGVLPSSDADAVDRMHSFPDLSFTNGNVTQHAGLKHEQPIFLS